ncbi:succinoglycan biosynthesis protein [Amylibacter marinus]|uniref:Succinoglycan biosynthesis protein n=1 Tax=Amylibacter marinus TaxID=1475483 RepID=A0ABQ5VXS4_9RHOB|nr:thermonuclease family protein [Amylibacter marinus]GLQ36241.1 succinoglycan biosynthesis protein [Amylibacter marinus]
MRHLFISGFITLFLALPSGANVVVVDGDTLILYGKSIRLEGIDAPEAGQSCLDKRGKKWACGTAASAALVKLLRGGKLRCKTLDIDRYGRSLARCHVGRNDINAEMVSMGMAWAFVRYSQEYVPQEQDAKRGKRGIWQGRATPAWEYRRQSWRNAEITEECPIKGNITESGKIYHMPWSKWYNRTRISPSKGERWFCSEAEARAAGWRAARNY